MCSTYRKAIKYPRKNILATDLKADTGDRCVNKVHP